MKAQMIKMSDNALVELFQNDRDNRVFDILVERHQKSLRSFIMRQVKRDYDMCSDVMQDVLVKAMNAILKGQYRNQERFFGWLLIVAKNHIRDIFRSSRYKNTSSLDAMENGNVPDYAEDSLSVAVEKEESLTMMEQYINMLPESQRRVVSMRLDEVPFREIARIEGVSINTALGRMNYAVKNLRALFEEAA